MNKYAKFKLYTPYSFPKHQIIQVKNHTAISYKKIFVWGMYLQKCTGKNAHVLRALQSFFFKFFFKFLMFIYF